jgi:hypothetical protein
MIYHVVINNEIQNWTRHGGEIMIIIAIPLLVCAVGLIIFLVTGPDKPKIARIGEIMFAVGLFFLVWHSAGAFGATLKS